jgi:hypothetical protein
MAYFLLFHLSRRQAQTIAVVTMNQNHNPGNLKSEIVKSFTSRRHQQPRAHSLSCTSSRTILGDRFGGIMNMQQQQQQAQPDDQWHNISSNRASCNQQKGGNERPEQEDVSLNFPQKVSARNERSWFLCERSETDMVMSSFLENLVLALTKALSGFSLCSFFSFFS